MKLDNIVGGVLKIGLVCSALYFGARHSEYILHVVDRAKQKYFPAIYERDKHLSFRDYQEKLRLLRTSEPIQYNAILLTDFGRNTHVRRTPK